MSDDAMKQELLEAAICFELDDDERAVFQRLQEQAKGDPLLFSVVGLIERLLLDAQQVGFRLNE